MSALAQHTLQKPERRRVEQYISDVFQHHHSATLKYFLPTLFSLSDEVTIKAAIGVGPLNKEEAFLEHYLTQPVEASVSEAAQKIVARSNIAEVGNLACSCGGASRQLIAALSEYLSDLGIEWAVFTGTSMVSVVLRRLRIETHCLGDATPERLGAQLSDWGTYYSHNPKVMLVNVEQAKHATKGISKFEIEAHV
ncbi:MAG: thermostable hemolysin [Pseudomonadales bacterium]